MAFDEIVGNRLLQSMFLSGGVSLAGEDSTVGAVGRNLQQVQSAQSQANLQSKMFARLLGEGVDFSSDKEGKIKIVAKTTIFCVL